MRGTDRLLDVAADAGASSGVRISDRPIIDLPDLGLDRTAYLSSGETLRVVTGLGTEAAEGWGFYLDGVAFGDEVTASSVGGPAPWSEAPTAILSPLFDDDGAGADVVTARLDLEAEGAPATTYIERVTHYTRFPAVIRAVEVGPGYPHDIEIDDLRVTVATEEGAHVWARPSLEPVLTVEVDAAEGGAVRVATRGDALAVVYPDRDADPLRPRLLLRCTTLP